MVLKHSLGNVSFNWEVSDLLKVAARQAAAHLAQMRASNQLIVARQFESFNRTTTFIIHDLKNLVAQLSLLLANAEKHKHNPEFQADMLDTVESAVARMNKVLAQLRRGSDEAQAQSVALTDILDRRRRQQAGIQAASHPGACRPRTCACAPTANVSPAPSAICCKMRWRPPRRTVDVILRAFEDAGQAIIEIIDTGSGMDDEFIRTRLFQPFDSTKGAGMGIGAYECRETLRALGGNIEVDSTPGKGTHFRLSLPLDNNSYAGGDAA